MAIRKVVTRSGRGLRGYFPSTKLGRMVAWESPLERDAILLFEYSPGVVSYEEQPELILYPDGDEVRRYFPDFEITTASGIKLHIEVKNSRKLSIPKTAAKYRTIAAHYQSEGRHYRILTDREIRQEPLFSNLKCLTQYHRPSETLASALDHVARKLRNGALQMGALGLDTPSIWRLMAHGHLHCDLSSPITASSLMSLVAGGCDDTLYF